MSESPKRIPKRGGSRFGIWNALRMQRATLQFVAEVGRSCGDLGRISFGPVRSYLVNHPDLIHQVLVTDAGAYRKLPFQTRVLSQIEGRGLLVSEGERWRKHRLLLAPAFQQGRMESYGNVAVDFSERAASRWSDGGEIEIVEEMTNLALLIMARSFFGADLSSEADRWRHLVRDLSDSFLVEMRRFFIFPDWVPLPSVRRKNHAIRSLDAKVWEFIRGTADAGTAAEAAEGEVLPLLLAAVRDGQITERDARDEVVTLFNSGHDTTAAGLTWLFYLIAAHPEVEERLVEEIRAVCGGRRPLPADVAGLEYTRQVVSEALRLYPPGWALFTRKAVADTELGGYRVPAGTWIMIFPFVTHRDPRFFPDPLRFDPDRFAAGRVDEIPKYAYLPFGAGPHSCIGRHLAMMQMTLAAAAVLQDWRLVLPRDRPPPEPEVLLSIWPRGGLRLRTVKRS